MALRKTNYLLRDIKNNKVLWIMVIPAIVFFLIFSYIPMVGVYYAFTSYNYAGGLFGSKFIGLKNFHFLFQGGRNAQIWILTRNTLLYNIAFIGFGNLLAIVTSIILSELASKAVKKVTQSIMLLPSFLSYVIVGVFIYNIFNYEFGLANNILHSLGLQSMNFYGQTGFWKYVLVIANLWKGFGYSTIIYLAAITGIDRSIYEAADIDGATVMQKIRNITLPLLKPTFVILLLLALGGIMKGQFELFYQVIGNNGVLFRATDIIDTYVYRMLTVRFDIGMGAAAGLYQSMFGFFAVMIVNGFVRKVAPEQSLF